MAMGWKPRVPLLAAALWWGSLGTVGFLVVPSLFANATTPAQAGALAAKLFELQTWVSVACGLAILAFLASNRWNPRRVSVKTA